MTDRPSPSPVDPRPGRREFLRSSLLAAAAATLSQSPAFDRFLAAAEAEGLDLVEDTLNGLLAFVVPGADPYSLAQGESTAEPGGVEAGVTAALVETLDRSAPYLPAFSAVVASILNDLALLAGAPAGGEPIAPFSRLSFAQKAAVFQIMDGTEALAALGGVLPAVVAFLAYSEAGVFDEATRSLTSRPVGWEITSYSGVADGRNELRGDLHEHGRGGKGRKGHA